MITLFEYLGNSIKLDSNGAKDFETILNSKSILKNQVFLREGSKASEEFFVSEGVVRAFIIDEQGNEKSVAFYSEGQFISTTTRRSNNGFSIHSYQALTDSTICSFNSDAFMELTVKYTEFSKLVAHVKHLEVERLQKRDECLLQVSALEKYQKFLEHYPLIENLIPHYFIASYLGITPVTLSRIRGKKTPH